MSLFQAAFDVQTFAEEMGWRYCFIGGIAVLRWGQPRVTRDVDLSLLTGFGGEDRFIQAALSRFEGRLPDTAAFARVSRSLLLRSPLGVGIDISLAALPFEAHTIERSSHHEFETGLSLRTCSAEDLVVMKLFAHRPIDLRDAESVVLRQRLDWNRIQTALQPLAEAKGDLGIMIEFERLRATSPSFPERP